MTPFKEHITPSPKKGNIYNLNRIPQITNHTKINELIHEESWDNEYAFEFPVEEESEALISDVDDHKGFSERSDNKRLPRRTQRFSRKKKSGV